MRLHRFLTPCCLMINIALGSLWARSHWYSDELAIERFSGAPAAPIHTLVTLASFRDCLVLDMERNHDGLRSLGQTPSSNGWLYRVAASRSSVVWDLDRPHFLGFAYAGPRDFGSLQPPESYRRLTLPWWSLTIAFAVPTGLLVRRDIRLSRAARRRRLGLCPTCGYDLRVQFSTQDSTLSPPPNCPEYGPHIPTPKPSSN